MAKKQKRIHHKLVRAMLIQLVIISGVTLLSVYGAAKVVEKVLIKQKKQYDFVEKLSGGERKRLYL